VKKSEIKMVLANMRISIPNEVEKELLELYGSCAVDDEGCEHEYTEQDIYEQLRKRLRLYKKTFIASCISF
jgi:hypothetical protein